MTAMILCNARVDFTWYQHINEVALQAGVTPGKLASGRIRRHLGMSIENAVEARGIGATELIREILPEVFPSLPNKNLYTSKQAARTNTETRKRLGKGNVFMKIRIPMAVAATLEDAARQAGMKSGAEFVAHQLVDQHGRLYEQTMVTLRRQMGKSDYPDRGDEPLDPRLANKPQDISTMEVDYVDGLGELIFEDAPAEQHVMH